jgi:hypothetical protein
MKISCLLVNCKLVEGMIVIHQQASLGLPHNGAQYIFAEALWASSFT